MQEATFDFKVGRKNYQCTKSCYLKELLFLAFEQMGQKNYLDRGLKPWLIILYQFCCFQYDIDPTYWFTLCFSSLNTKKLFDVPVAIKNKPQTENKYARGWILTKVQKEKVVEDAMEQWSPAKPLVFKPYDYEYIRS